MNGNIQLVQSINTAFDEEEVKTLCFTIGIDYDSLPAKGKTAKVRELVRYCDKHNMPDALIATCFSMRPNAYWGEAVMRIPADTIQQMLPKMSGTASTQLRGMQIARMAARQNAADADRSRIKAIAVATLATQVYQILEGFLK